MYEDHCEQSLRGDCMNKFTKKEDLHKHILRDNALSGYSEKAAKELRRCLNEAKGCVCQQQK